MSVEEYELYERDEPSLSGVERQLFDAVSREEPWSLVERFADLERVSGSADERCAAEYLLERLDALGIDHRRYDPDLYISVPESAWLRVLDPDRGIDDVVPDPDRPAVKTVAFSGDGTVDGELVDASAPGSGEGSGDDAEENGETSDDGVDDLLSADVSGVGDVSGDVVLVEGLLPIEAIEALERKGASGIVVKHPHSEEPHEGIATPIWGGAPEPGEEGAIPDLPIVTVARPIGDRLQALASEGVAVELTAEVTTGWEACPLVEARIEGEADDEDFVLLHGHYDSWHVGIADNATGDAALLELARVLDDRADEFRRNLRIAWWPGHSTGRYAGSTWYAEAFATELDERCVAQVNVDSPGAVDATEFEDMVVWMPEADGLCRSAIADVCGKSAAENRPPRAGDYSFSNLGVTGLFMLSSNIPRDVRDARGYHAVGGCGGNADAWHLTTDTLDKADPEVLVRDVRVYAIAVARLLREPVLPLDHRRTVERHREVLAEYDDEAGQAFDLAPVLSELDRLDDAVADLYEAVEGDVDGSTGAIDTDAANAAIADLSRRLVPLGFCSEGRFEQDPATARPPYPAMEPATDLPDLDDDERKSLRVELRRARNAAVHELREARREVRRALDGHGRAD